MASAKKLQRFVFLPSCCSPLLSFSESREAVFQSRGPRASLLKGRHGQQARKLSEDVATSQKGGFAEVRDGECPGHGHHPGPGDHGRATSSGARHCVAVTL